MVGIVHTDSGHLFFYGSAVRTNQILTQKRCQIFVSQDIGVYITDLSREAGTGIESSHKCRPTLR